MAHSGICNRWKIGRDSCPLASRRVAQGRYAVGSAAHGILSMRRTNSDVARVALIRRVRRCWYDQNTFDATSAPCIAMRGATPVKCVARRFQGAITFESTTGHIRNEKEEPDIAKE
jgi:hypothetical protein